MRPSIPLSPVFLLENRQHVQQAKAMLEAGSPAGQYDTATTKYDRVQFLTVKQILEEKCEFHTPEKVEGSLSSPFQSSFC
jgi:hypothetical protein